MVIRQKTSEIFYWNAFIQYSWPLCDLVDYIFGPVATQGRTQWMPCNQKLLIIFQGQPLAERVSFNSTDRTMRLILWQSPLNAATHVVVLAKRPPHSAFILVTFKTHNHVSVYFCFSLLRSFKWNAVSPTLAPGIRTMSAESSSYLHYPQKHNRYILPCIFKK